MRKKNMRKIKYNKKTHMRGKLSVYERESIGRWKQMTVKENYTQTDTGKERDKETDTAAKT